MMVNVNYQVGRPYHHVGGWSLGISIGYYIDCINWGEKTFPCEWHHFPREGMLELAVVEKVS